MIDLNEIFGQWIDWCLFNIFVKPRKKNTFLINFHVNNLQQMIFQYHVPKTKLFFSLWNYGLPRTLIDFYKSIVAMFIFTVVRHLFKNAHFEISFLKLTQPTFLFIGIQWIFLNAHFQNHISEINNTTSLRSFILWFTVGFKVFALKSHFRYQ